MAACYAVTVEKHQVGELYGLAEGVQQDHSSGKRGGV